MKNQYTIQALYHMEDPIEILFNQIEMLPLFIIKVNYPFTDRQFADIGIAQILATQ